MKTLPERLDALERMGKVAADKDRGDYIDRRSLRARNRATMDYTRAALAALPALLRLARAGMRMRRTAKFTDKGGAMEFVSAMHEWDAAAAELEGA